MNKKFLIAWVVLFIAWMAGDFLVHGVLLHAFWCRVYLVRIRRLRATA